jgi:glutathione S-transferase
VRLLSATPSPYARKVRIALVEKGLPFELVTEVPWNQDASAPRWNPLGKIPVLILDDGTAVYESRFILEYLELKHPSPPLLPRDVDGILAAKRLEVLGDGVCDAVVLSVLEGLRPAERRSDAWIARQRRKIDAGVAEIARLVHPDATYANGAAFGLGDIAVGSMLGYLDLRFPQLDWRSAHPHLVALFERLSERPSFRSTVPSAQAMPDEVG